jgi:peptidoglycan LD-endopeptidase LytH
VTGHGVHAQTPPGRSRPATGSRLGALLACMTLGACPSLTNLPLPELRPSDLVDTFHDTRGEGEHEAIDIVAPRGTPVLAVADGVVRKLFLSRAGGLTVYQFDREEKYCFYYAHLDRYAEGLREGMPVRGGQVVGYVGTSGNAPKNSPHLHFTIFRLGPEKRWWEGEAVNPHPYLLELLTRGRPAQTALGRGRGAASPVQAETERP